VPQVEAAEIFRRTTDLLSRGAAEEALAILVEAVARHAEDAGIACRFADALHATGRLAEANAAYRRALALDGTIFDAWYGLGCAELSGGAYGAAIAALRGAVAVRPERVDAHFNLGKALFEMGEIDSAIAHFRSATTAEDAALREQALAAIACIIPGSGQADNALILQARRDWTAGIEATCERLVEARASARLPRRKLRIGYVSAFFGARNWMKPVWGVINNHDRAAFELHLFSDGQDPSIESGYRDRSADYVHRVWGASNASLAGHVARAEIDVLVDLNAYSFQRRLGLFARHPAPVTLGWFNMFATSGLSGLDYIVADAAVIPPEEESFYCERVLRVDGSYLAFSVLYPVPDVAPPPCRSGEGLVLGCLCSQYKITEDVVAAWARILHAAPQTRLLVKNRHLDDGSTQSHLHQRFAARGIAPSRVLLEGGAEHFAFLETYARIDVALDTFPYNGGTTTMEALWQGVPVLTVNGDRWASRTSRSLLEAAGLGAWVLPTREAYVEKAIALAHAAETPRRLAELRAGMRRRLEASRVCDSAGLCRQLERIFRDVAARAGVRG